MAQKSPKMRKMAAQGSQRWPKGSKRGLKVVQKRPKIDFGDLEFDMLFTVRTPYWEVLGGFPKRQKYGCLFRALPRGVQRCTYGPKVVKRVESGNPKGFQNGAKSDKKGSQKHALIPMTPFGCPIGGPGAWCHLLEFYLIILLHFNLLVQNYLANYS